MNKTKRHNKNKNKGDSQIAIHRQVKSLHEYVTANRDDSSGHITSTLSMQEQLRTRFYSTYNVTVGLHTAFVLGGILFVTVMYLLYKTKCRKPLRRQFRKMLVCIKGAPPPKVTDSKCVGTTIQLEPTKGSWICFDNPDIEPSVEIDALKATALWIMQNHEDELQNLHEVSGIILRVDPDVIHAHEAKEKATWLAESQHVPLVSTPMSSESCYYDNVPQVLNVPIENHFLQVPNICVESPRPESLAPISFARQNRLHISASHPSFQRTSWEPSIAPSEVYLGQSSLFTASQPSLPINTVDSIPPTQTVPDIVAPTSSTANDDSASDSQTEHNPLLGKHKNLHRYENEVLKKSNQRRKSSQKSNQSRKSSKKSRGSAKGKHEQFHELLSASGRSSDASCDYLANSDLTNSAYAFQETVL